LAQNANQINIFPNPSNGLYNLNRTKVKGVSLIQVFKMSGESVKQIIVNENDENILIDLQYF
jgi:hypothetical protein